MNRNFENDVKINGTFLMRWHPMDMGNSPQPAAGFRGLMEKRMTKMELKQIEADVVIVIENPDLDVVETHPYWDCELDHAGLRAWAAQRGLECAERCGGGFTIATIFDYRNLPRTPL